MLAEIIALTLIFIAIWLAITVISFIVDCVKQCEFALFALMSGGSAMVLFVIWLIWVALILLGG